ncbi:MAG: GNAT family protein [Stappiaceae bacterium]
MKQSEIIAQGPTVQLRFLTIDDAQPMFETLSDEEAMRLTGTKENFSFSQVEAHCSNIQIAEDRADFGILAGGRLIGEVVLNHIDTGNRCASLRIAIWYQQARGHGYGTEALGLALNYGFETLALNRIELEVYAFNPRARHVYEKLGFVAEGTRRQALWWDGVPVDAILMGLLRSEFKSTV